MSAHLRVNPPFLAQRRHRGQILPLHIIHLRLRVPDPLQLIRIILAQRLLLDLAQLAVDLAQELAHYAPLLAQPRIIIYNL